MKSPSQKSIFSHQEWFILALFFVLVLFSSSMFLIIDQSPIGGIFPWHVRLFGYIGLALSLFVNFPLIATVHLINITGNSEIIPYDVYFSILPFATAFVYTTLLATGIAMWKKRAHRKS